MKSKYWYEVTSYAPGGESTVEQTYVGKENREVARAYAKVLSQQYAKGEFVINGYDISETWRDGKCETEKTIR